MKMNCIVVATDFSEASQAALALGSTFARDAGACLHIVHVATPDIGFGGDELDVMIPQPLENPISAQLLEQSVPTDPRIPCEHHLLTGSPAEEIVRFATDQHADLIVVGTHGRKGALRILLGSVAESVVRHATCPVLTVKAPSADAP